MRGRREAGARAGTCHRPWPGPEPRYREGATDRWPATCVKFLTSTNAFFGGAGDSLQLPYGRARRAAHLRQDPLGASKGSLAARRSDPGLGRVANLAHRFLGRVAESRAPRQVGHHRDVAFVRVAPEDLDQAEKRVSALGRFVVACMPLWTAMEPPWRRRLTHAARNRPSGALRRQP
jgi:hypothetical protein